MMTPRNRTYFLLSVLAFLGSYQYGDSFASQSMLVSRTAVRSDLSKMRMVNGTPPESDESEFVERKKNSSLLRLAQLSLEDYKWRLSVFKETEADRKVEESLARMMGDDATYIRPMDASETKIGPLGLFEKSSVEWLTKVIEEEGRRAKKIISLEGILVRPKDAAFEDGELGPLGFMEKQFVDFLDTVRTSEKERTRSKTLRPKDMDESTRGPLGEAELRAVTGIREVLESEKLRVRQSRIGGKPVRPIDIPGPLGEFEMTVLDVVKAEQQRKLDRESELGIMLVRPKDSSRKGPLGELEQAAFMTVQKLTNEEKERLRNIQRVLDENRPMDQESLSPLGIIESVMVGIVRAPILLFQIVLRVKELLNSEPLDESDAEILRDSQAAEKSSSKKNKD